MCRIHILSKARTQAVTLKMLTRRYLVHVPKRLKVQTRWESRWPVDTVTSCMADRRRRSLINHHIHLFRHHIAGVIPRVLGI